MKTIKAKASQEPSSLSFSRRYFNWRKIAEDEDNDEVVLTYGSSSHSFSGLSQMEKQKGVLMSFKSVPVAFNPALDPPTRKKQTKFRSALALFGKSRSGSSALGSKLIGTLFGYRRGHVSIAFQEDPKSSPAFLIQISTPTCVLVKEMASGLVRVALECEKKPEKKRPKLLDEPLWRAYCNGKKCGYGTRQECGPEELKVLAAVGPITMGAGVLPGEEDDGVGEEGELMYMRAKFERVAGSKDSETFYMVNPGGNGGPELSLYFLRV